MGLIVRRAMLQASKNCPDVITLPLTWSDRIRNICTCCVLFATDIAIYCYSKHYLIDVLHCSPASVVVWSLAVSAGITIGLYVYYVYVVDWLSGSANGSRTGKAKKSE